MIIVGFIHAKFLLTKTKQTINGQRQSHSSSSSFYFFVFLFVIHSNFEIFAWLCNFSYWPKTLLNYFWWRTTRNLRFLIPSFWLRDERALVLQMSALWCLWDFSFDGLCSGRGSDFECFEHIEHAKWTWFFCSCFVLFGFVFKSSSFLVQTIRLFCAPVCNHCYKFIYPMMNPEEFPPIQLALICHF